MKKENKRIFKSNYAITLIALVVSILVLLILVGVTLQLVVGEDGIVGRTISSRKQHEASSEKELVELAVSSAMVDGQGVLTTENLNKALKEQFDNEENVQETSLSWFYKVKQRYRIYNDGKVEASLLPIEYQQVEYIESTGTQYIDTKIKNDINFGYIQSKFQITSTSESRYYLFGCYSKNGKNRLQFSFSNPLFIGIGNTYTNLLVNEKISTNPITVTFTATQCIVDNEILYSGSGYSNISDSININIFSCNNVEGFNDYKAKDMRLFYFYIHNNENKLIRNFLPCYCTTTVTDVDGKTCESGTIGLYDLVEDQFYTNQGTGEFLKGEDV